MLLHGPVWFVRNRHILAIGVERAAQSGPPESIRELSPNDPRGAAS
jgi:hypothetical protein